MYGKSMVYTSLTICNNENKYLFKKYLKKKSKEQTFHDKKKTLVLIKIILFAPCYNFF